MMTKSFHTYLDAFGHPGSGLGGTGAFRWTFYIDKLMCIRRCYAMTVLPEVPTRYPLPAARR